VSSRVRLLKGPPFSFEFKNILSKFRWTEFNQVFRNDFITNELVQQQASRRTTEADSIHTQEPLASTAAHSLSMPWRSRYVAPASNGASSSVNENSLPLPQTSGLTSRYEGVEVPEDGNGSGVAVPASPQHEPSPALSSASSTQQVWLRTDEQPITDDIAAALINSTNEVLLHSPKALDFAVVKQKAAEKLGVSSSFWGKDEQDEWFLKSKNVIKMAVVSYDVDPSSFSADNMAI